ncbi:nuclear apoptosis-inducing factor 1-like [Pleurodeles waltl]|uniref:nuclear apoptosis-inducing factor 1-like n=1 Tax=Pleurodeles waltl TaxID=8319 RepID=UPI00370974A2
MANDGNGKDKGERKQKLKFSEEELEVLTEEVVKNHDQLFGKHSLQVPESEKREMWIDIQTKICVVGVAQHSIKEIRKQWYNLRSSARQRVTSRLKEARSTEGGPPTQTPSTPMEDMVESTLPPEAVSGVTEIDISGTPGASKDVPGPNAAESVQAPTRYRARVLSLIEFTLDSDELQEEVPTPPPETAHDPCNGPLGEQQLLVVEHTLGTRRARILQAENAPDSFLQDLDFLPSIVRSVEIQASF